MLRLCEVDVSFRSEGGNSLFGPTRQQVLFDVSLDVKQGSCLGILGESGSGKSTTGRVICGLLKPDKGQLVFNDVDIYAQRRNKKLLQEHISVVFQDYTTSANPRFTVGDIIAEGLHVYRRRMRKRERGAAPADTTSGIMSQEFDMRAETIRLLQQVGLSEEFLPRYPHQLSGGQLQRVCIARAIACRPKIILLDEAISALDAHTQVQVMDLLAELKEIHGLTYIFITHDLTAITYMCDEVLFLCEGRVTEHCRVEDIGNVQDEYAKRLLASIMDFEHADARAT